MEKDADTCNEAKNDKGDQRLDEFFSQNEKYIDFLRENKINVEEYIRDMKEYRNSGLRCIRISPLSSNEKIKTELREMGFKPHPIFDDLYLIDKEFKISSLPLYKNGQIYGIEASSSIVVKCLNPSPDDVVLDVCCSPGAKLLQIGDEMMKKLINSEEIDTAKLANLKRKLQDRVIGNDISKHRLNITKNLVEKYGYGGIIKLTLNDAVKLKRAQVVKEGGEIDKILCDVECSHDGSFKHILKFVEEGNGLDGGKEAKGKSRGSFEERKKAILGDMGISNKERKRRLKQLEDRIRSEEDKRRTGEYFSEYKSKMKWDLKRFEERVLDPKKIKILNKLQEEILTNCLDLVKNGGEVFYATCSLSKSQNEDIVTKCLQQGKGRYKILDALDSLEHRQDLISNPIYGVREGFLDGTYRFSPNSLSTGGLFLARIHKKG